MEELFTTISKILHPKITILEYSELTQNIDDENIILWNPAPLEIDSKTYEDFKIAIKKRSSKHYTLSHKLPYYNFCIALLCCNGYSLNHNKTNQVSDKAFAATWRNLVILSATSSPNVTKWIEKHISSRTAISYCNLLSVKLDNASFEDSTSNETKLDNIKEDIEILFNISTKDKITRIDPSDTSSSNKHSILFFDSLHIPESHLHNLEIEHKLFNSK